MNKPQLTVSMMLMGFRCWIQWQRRFGARFECWHEEEIIKPGIALATGIATHKAVETNLKNKLNCGELLQRDEVSTIALEAFDHIWMQGILLDEEEAMNPRKARGQAIDQTVQLSVLHHDMLAPKINPLAVEERFVITMDNYPYDLAGKKDIREDGVVRDTKTMARRPAADAPRSLQMAMYSLSEKVERGKLPDRVVIDALVKTKTPQLVVCEAVPQASWIDPLMRRIEQAMKIIESVKEDKGHFTPANPDDWCCTQKYCGYAASCPYWSGK